jgi:transcriptional regulator with XRE-family HTH domain
MKNKSITLHPLADPSFSRWARTVTVGERLRWLLEHRGLTQTDLAEKMKKLAEDDPRDIPKQSRAAVTQSSISNVITNYSRKPNAPTLLRMAAVLSASPAWLMFGEGQPFEITTVGRKDEKSLLAAYRELDDDAKAALLIAARAMTKK